MKKYIFALFLIRFVKCQDCIASDGTDDINLWGECYSIEVKRQ